MDWRRGGARLIIYICVYICIYVYMYICLYTDFIIYCNAMQYTAMCVCMSIHIDRCPHKHVLMIINAHQFILYHLNKDVTIPSSGWFSPFFDEAKLRYRLVSRQTYRRGSVEQREQSAKNARLQNKGASTNIGLSKTRVPVNPIVNHPFPIVQWQFWGGITYITHMMYGYIWYNYNVPIMPQ